MEKIAEEGYDINIIKRSGLQQKNQNQYSKSKINILSQRYTMSQ